MDQKLDNRLLTVPHNTTVIAVDGGPLNRTIVAKTAHSSRTAARHHARGLAIELALRWNAYLPLISHMDSLLVQMEDNGTVLLETLKNARALVTSLGFDEARLGKLADLNEAKQNK